jgi:uncharacterized protein (DUF1800 family)
MADFWTNHFNIYGRKGFSAYRKGKDENDVIRTHALGSFPKMLLASASSPAMLVYLDNNFNRKGVPNENYARELLELHTLGVHGGYTYGDIQNVARCMTGWTTERRFLRPYGRLVFESEHHDDDAKVLLGHKIPSGGGANDRDRVLEILATHPSTARYLSTKLAIHFLGKAEPKIVEAAAQAYLHSGGDIAATLRPILLSPLMMGSAAGDSSVKRPFDFVVSALRATDADIDLKCDVPNHLRAMGQPTYEWPMPDGYPTDLASWTGSLLARWNFAFAVVSGGVAGVQPRISPLKDAFEGPLDQFLGTTFLGTPKPGWIKGVVASMTKLTDGERLIRGAALCLCSPSFQWR